MKRDKDGNHWPEREDLENGCPCCGAELRESRYEEPGYHRFYYRCGGNWHAHCLDKPTPGLYGGGCAFQLAINASAQAPAIKRIIEAADKVIDTEKKNKRGYSVDSWETLWEAISEFDAARKELP
jgi:hypothetical protein